MARVLQKMSEDSEETKLKVKALEGLVRSGADPWQPGLASRPSRAESGGRPAAPPGVATARFDIRSPDQSEAGSQDGRTEVREDSFNQGGQRANSERDNLNSAQVRETAVPYQPGFQPTRAAMARAETDAAPLQPIHPKDINKPEKYSGNVDDWLQWSKSFKQFLDSKDPRWEQLLNEIEMLRGKPVKAINEFAWVEKLGLGNVVQFKKQLHSYLMNYTKGSAIAIVEAGDVSGVLDAWRQMADKGHSQREAHVMTLREKA